MHRKVVTVLFCDVVGSTALGESTDPEALQGLLAAYFERMKTIVEHHGGTVEKFIGDAVMAVFGVPAVHEDDALRACRAAVEMRDAFPELGIEGRIGVSTGEVVTGTEERLATGDAVNVAARLQQAAQPNEVLIGQATLALVEGAVATEAVEALQLKGKSSPVSAFRLVRVDAAPERSHGSTFVGRERDLEQIRAAWELAGREQRCELVTIVAEAGVGKTRLVAEAVARLGARVVGGRCLPYGEGITYWPVTAAALQLEDVEVEERVREPLRAVLGDDIQTTPQEIAWAFRKLVEEAAPIVVVFDDVHWGEDVFLDLLEHIGLLATAPILLVAIARPELLDRRPAWPVALRLEPLPETDVERLIDGRVSVEVAARLIRAAGGNPLFVQELLAMADEDDDEVEVPPNLHALLAARLDQLGASERRVLERGSVEGELFHLGSVATLTPEEPNVTGHLASLVRRALVRPDRPQLPGEDGFRFHHLLIRDAAYDSLPKADRAELHECFANWLDDHGAELVEVDEIVGYHLEQAARFRQELGAPDGSLAERASERLAAAGTRAHNRSDIPAALNLYARALALRPEEPAVLLRLQIGTALRLTGGAGLSSRSLLEGAEVAAAAGDDAGELVLRVAATSSTLLSGSADEETSRALASKGLALFEARNDDVGLAFACELLAFLEHNRVRSIPRLVAAERMLAHARAAGARWLEDTAKRQTIQSHIWGPTPFPEIERMLAEEAAMLRSHPTLMARFGAIVGRLGRVEEGRALIQDARERSAEFGSWNLYWGQQTWDLEKYGGDLEAAERALRGEVECGERAGMIGTNSTTMGYLAECLYARGKLDEMEQWIERSRTATDEYDIESQLAWRKPDALLQARVGDRVAAAAVAEEAVALADGTDDPTAQADARVVLAETLVLADRNERANGVLWEAIELYEAKGNVMGAAHARDRLDAFQEAAQT